MTLLLLLNVNNFRILEDWRQKDCVVIEAFLVLDLRKSKVPKFSQIFESVLTPSGEARGHACHAKHDQKSPE